MLVERLVATTGCTPICGVAAARSQEAAVRPAAAFTRQVRQFASLATNVSWARPRCENASTSRRAAKMGWKLCRGLTTVAPQGLWAPGSGCKQRKRLGTSLTPRLLVEPNLAVRILSLYTRVISAPFFAFSPGHTLSFHSRAPTVTSNTNQCRAAVRFARSRVEAPRSCQQDSSMGTCLPP